MTVYAKDDPVKPRKSGSGRKPKAANVKIYEDAKRLQVGEVIVLPLYSDTV